MKYILWVRELLGAFDVIQGMAAILDLPKIKNYQKTKKIGYCQF